MNKRIPEELKKKSKKLKEESKKKKKRKIENLREDLGKIAKNATIDGEKTKEALEEIRCGYHE